MRPPRLRLRTFLIAVAVVGIVMGTLTERHYRFRTLARDYGRQVMALGVGLPTPRKERRYPTITQFGQLVDDSPEAARLEQQYWWLREMTAKYEDAARNPWLPVAPDPPPPG